MNFNMLKNAYLSVLFILQPTVSAPRTTPYCAAAAKMVREQVKTKLSASSTPSSTSDGMKQWASSSPSHLV